MTAAPRFPASLPDRPARPRLGLLGAGWLGRDRLSAIARSGLADVMMVADANPEWARAALDAVGGATVAASIDDLLAADLDGIVIASPTALHADHSAAALERGLAVFCERPLGRTVAECRRVVRAAREADRLLAVDLGYRFADGMDQLRRLVRAGELGRVFSVDLAFHSAYGPDRTSVRDRAQTGGGCVIDLGLGLLDLGLWTLDFPPVAEVSARRFAGGERLPPGDPRIEDFATARIDLEDGATISLACSWRLAAGQLAVIEAAFYGTRGGGALRNRGGSLHDLDVERFRHTMKERLASSSREWSSRGTLDWVSRLATGKRFDPEVANVVRVAQVIDDIYRGA